MEKRARKFTVSCWCRVQGDIAVYAESEDEAMRLAYEKFAKSDLNGFEATDGGTEIVKKEEGV